MVQRRSKTDKLDAELLANLLRINQIPLAYIPPEPYQQLRDLTRTRGRLVQEQAAAKIKLRDDLGPAESTAPYRKPFGTRAGLVRQARLRPHRESGPRRVAAAAGALPQAVGDPGQASRRLAGRLPAGRSAHGDPRHRPLLGVADRGRIGRGRSLPPREQVAPMPGSRRTSTSPAATATAAGSPAKARPGCGGFSWKRP